MLDEGVRGTGIACLPRVIRCTCVGHVILKLCLVRGPLSVHFVLFLLVDPHPMTWPTPRTDPFWGPATPPDQAVWIGFPEDSPTGISGPVLLFILGNELRFGQQCEEQLFLFGDTVYSAWRVWRLSPLDVVWKYFAGPCRPILVASNAMDREL